MEKIIVADNGCWLWQAAHSGRGYGLFSLSGLPVYAHRWSYEWFVGPIPTGRQLGHFCYVKDCVNPDHVRPVTGSENLLDGDVQRNGTRDFYVCGHPRTQDNTLVESDTRRGKLVLLRKCLTCRRSGGQRG